MSQALSVLIIEDSEDDALLVLRELRRDHLSLIWERVQTAAALQNLLAQKSWDVIISDYCLPSFNAPAALAIVNQLGLDLPFIVVSGTIGERLAVDMMKAGAHDYLMKDNLTRLPEVVRREVREAQIRVERRQAAANLAKRDRYLTALVEVQRQLLETTVNPAVYHRILHLLGPTAEADRMYVFENHRDADGRWLTSQRAEWCAPGISPQIDNPDLQNIRYEQDAPRWQQILSRGEVIHGAIAAFPETERQILEAQGICSILVIPLIANGEFFGFIGLDDCQTAKQWDSLEVDLLRSAAAAIALAKEREQAIQDLAQLNRELEDRVERRTAALQDSEAKLQAILDFSPAIIYVKDLEGRHILVNQSFLRMFQCSLDEIVGKTNADLFPPEVARILDAHDRTIIETGLQQYEEAIHLGDTVYTFLSNKFLLCDGAGHPYGLCGISTDISDRKQAEAQLQQTNEELAHATRLKDEFLANMSHELRTPLNAILGMTEGLQDSVFGPINEGQRKALQTVEQSGFHLLELINDILDVAKIESGQIELEIAPTSPLPLFHDSLTFIKQQASKKQIQLDLQLPPSLPDLLVDERRIRQVLINLLNNAVKFTPAGGHITLEARCLPRSADPLPPSANIALRTDHSLHIAVTDTGIGIAPEHLNKLFQPFIQIDSALNRQYSGTGLGLALVKRIVELHGGQVGVQSTVGVGSCFTIDLPCTVPQPSSSPLKSPYRTSPEPAQSATIHTPLLLLVEDNEANIGTLASYLTAKGYRLLLAKNGKEAIALAQAHLPDLIVMDIQMPEMDGITAIQVIRQDPTLVAVPIIALTALAMAGDREQCLAAGASDYLTKPVKLKQLVATIQNLLRV